MQKVIDSLKIDTESYIQSMNITTNSLHDKICPHCKNSKNIIKFGKFKGIQRYRCKDCKKTFSDVTNSPFYRSKKKLSYWIEYAKYMFNGMTIRDCAKAIKINIATAFFWRHKILDSIFFLEGKEELSGDIQIRDVYFPENHKGQKGMGMDKRPDPFTRRIDLNQSISVLCLIDCNNKIVVDPICKSVFNLHGVKLWLEKRIELAPEAEFISSVMKFNNNKLATNVFNNKIKKGTPEETFLGRALGKKLETWIGKKFKGVATKYLNNYLVWFKYYTEGRLTTYKKFLSEKLNILMSFKNTPFSVNRMMDYKHKKVMLYGNK